MHPSRILVVDDDPDIRALVSHTLRRDGFAVTDASCGAEALEVFTPDDFQLVISDIRMPEMSGIELLGEIKRKSPEVPVILITGYGSVQNAVEAMQGGACDYILKPFSAKVLSSAVGKIGLETGQADEAADADLPGKEPHEGRPIVTQLPIMRQLLQLALNIAPSSATVLIQGESGTGKELLARFIHENSAGRSEPYLAVNCAALPETLAESELFGHEKGAFTGAISRKIGKFEAAGRGTIVLDEISEMPPALQAKLLRVLQERLVDRIGGGSAVPIQARVVAITNVDLKKAVTDGKFRNDLYYRINVVPFSVPPLRERLDDIPLLAHHFCGKYCRMNAKPPLTITGEAMRRLKNHSWPGNIRELENTMERAVLIAPGPSIDPEHLFLEGDAPPFTGEFNGRIQAGMTVRDMEKELIVSTLEEVNQNRTRAAEMLGISIRTLRNKLNEYRSST